MTSITTGKRHGVAVVHVSGDTFAASCMDILDAISTQSGRFAIDFTECTHLGNGAMSALLQALSGDPTLHDRLILVVRGTNALAIRYSDLRGMFNAEYETLEEAIPDPKQGEN